MDAAPERKLSAIMSADVVGYSRMMAHDEAATLTLLKASRALIDSLVAGNRGRVVGSAGDGLLAEFASIVNAVDCAVRIQRALAERNAALPDDERMLYRIGINLGDVMVEGDDLFGDGVNIAARLQTLAEPGGVLISGAAFEQVRNKLALGFDYVGAQTVKNIERSVPVWRVLLGDEAGGHAAGASRAGADGASPAAASAPLSGPRSEGPAANPAAAKLRKLRRSIALAAVLIAFLLGINVLSFQHVWWFQWPSIVILFVLGLRVAWAMGR